jgi:hypothetical protein
VIHMASSWRSRGSEEKNGQFDGIRCGAVKVRPNYPWLLWEAKKWSVLSQNFYFSPLGHSNLSVFTINRIIVLLWEVSLSHPLTLGLHFC